MLLALVGIIVLIKYTEKNLLQTIEKEHIVCIQPGASTKSIIRTFNEINLFEPDWLFELYLTYIAKNESKYVNAGCHRIPKNITQLDLVNGLCNGKFVAQRKITIPEGLTYKEIAKRIAKQTTIAERDILNLCQNSEYLNQHGIENNNIDGYLLPDTYNFNFQVSAKEVLDRLIKEGKKIITSENINQAKTLGMSMYEIVILASIVEAETPVASEYASVAGVYHTRLRIGMALQADPTVQYALGSKAKLKKEWMNVNSPYNTYRYRGLPPTPINNPGKAAILATLNPEKHEFLYFVAIGDGSNKHNFAVDFEGHQKNIATYRKNRKNK